MARTPKELKDLALAPVAVAVDENLRFLRTRTPEELGAALELVLDRATPDPSRETRLAQVLEAAIRDVDLHGWQATMSDDGSAVRIAGGSASLDISVGATVLHYVEDGAAAPAAS
ncbi:hypothetical protein FSW04_02020 [Baekduia soli]|uniref:Uncharacterized protein n=1 Tax=Baekduia soli TaxID=496014 RepID=A0A5B8U0E6_9ACTN|nr:hypothetical protein [Baekduia soli]QEC46474.1 hypothetical protein FSW04_02020 [Baekduia soli]